jgi:hypothetical protein
MLKIQSKVRAKKKNKETYGIFTDFGVEMRNVVWLDGIQRLNIIFQQLFH